MSYCDFDIRRAELVDVDTILLWRNETAAWLTFEGISEQWSNPYPREKLELWVRRGETWMVSSSGETEPIATFTLSSQGSPDLWTMEELAEPALYLNKLNVKRSHAGLKIGEQLVEYCVDQAKGSGIGLIRIDVWTNNFKLRDYYEGMGFEYLRTVPDTVSGALYRRRVV